MNHHKLNLFLAPRSYRLLFPRRRHLRCLTTGSSDPPNDPKSEDPVDDVWNSIKALSADERQALSRRWFQSTLKLETAEEHFNNADVNQDGTLCKEEFHAYFTQRHQLPKLKKGLEDEDPTHDDTPSWKTYQQLALCTALPFVGFGFLDNFLMLATGDYIESSLGSSFHVSTMAAAALGNTFSDVAGIGMGGVIQNLCDSMGLPTPILSRAQSQLPRTRMIVLGSSAFGITVGCILGMVPLMWL